MKKLAFAALLCGGLAQLGAGCVSETQDVTGDIDVTWNLLTGDENTPTGCPAGATTMAIVTQDEVGNEIVDLFDCELQAGTLVRDPGTYVIYAWLTDEATNAQYAYSLSDEVLVVTGGVEAVNFNISIDRGSFYFDWVINYAGAPSDCAAQPVGDVTITSTLVGGEGTLYDDTAPCDQYALTTRGLPAPGQYTLSIQLLDPTNQAAIYTAPAIDNELSWGNDFVGLGTIELDAAGN